MEQLKKKVDDIKQISLLGIKIFSNLYEKKSIRKKDINDHRPKYWKFTGRKSVKNLNVNAAIGIASVW